MKVCVLWMYPHVINVKNIRSGTPPPLHGIFWGKLLSGKYHNLRCILWSYAWAMDELVHCPFPQAFPHKFRLWFYSYTLAVINYHFSDWTPITGNIRAGTTSLTHALTAVGLRSEHYTRNTLQLVHAVESPSNYDFAQLENIDAILDSPVPSVYLELLRYFPRARIILTVRDPESWLRSHNGHYDRFCNHEKHVSHSRFSAKRDSTEANDQLQLNTFSNTFYRTDMHVSPNRVLDFGTVLRQN